jgi:hypothetical protein
MSTPFSRRDFIAASGATVALSVLPRISPAAPLPAGLHGNEDALQRSFIDPPVTARPGMWWFWGETITTDHGITQDLEALKRVGFGTAVIYEQVFTDRPDALKSLSSEWMARVRFAAAECARLGLTLEINVGSGYVAGGPWITPELGMQRLVASELQVPGGRKFSGRLPQPPTRLGFYKDVAVLAYSSPAGDEALPVAPRYSSEPAGLDLGLLFDPESTRQVRIPTAPGGRPVLIQIDYGRSFTARSLTVTQRASTKGLVIATEMPGNWSDDFYGQGMHIDPPVGALESSTDGTVWEKICILPAIGYRQDSWNQFTYAFPARTARYFRLNLHGWGHNASRNDDDLVIGNVQLHGDARIDRSESKSGNMVDFSDPDRTPNYTGAEVIDPARIVDLTSHLGPDGTLTWDAPQGDWTILRLGHTPTGAGTKHGRPETMGLECDKLSAHASRVQFDNYVGRILTELKGVPGAHLAGVSMDSAESGSQNWTADFPEQFRRRCGYDLLHFLPAMMGRVVGSVPISDRFLFDVRRTIADLMSEEYFGTLRQLCHDAGMVLTAQAPGIATGMPSDNIGAKGQTDIPMGEFWMGQPNGTMDCKEAASAAHVYGKKVAAAESFTGSGPDVYPAMLKPLADAALANGINSFYPLAGAHQPWDDRKPGVSEDRFFLPYQRNNTWWEFSDGFWNTLARSSFMMQQGLPVMDILYHLGNDTPLKIVTWRMRPVPPTGYDYDVCGDEVLLTADVRDGRIVLPSGMSYRLLILDGGDRMTLAAARRLKMLVERGAVVLGSVKPIGTPGLIDGVAGDEEVRRVADELWAQWKPGEPGQHNHGSGRLVWGQTPAELLAALGVPKDFDFAGAGEPANILYAHRRTDAEDIYFIANHQAKAVSINGIFRVQGRIPQSWDPETGEINSLPHFEQIGDRVQVPLQLEQYSSRVIVFRKHPEQRTPAPGLVGSMPVCKELSGSWDVSFEPGLGAPDRIRLSQLISWPQSSDPGVRDYSGTATYVQQFHVEDLPAGTIFLDLGGVDVVASTSLNGHELGSLWKAPYAADVTKALRRGDNLLQVKVANLCINRLIADSALPESKRISWTLYKPFKPTDLLLPSGLLGPVVLRTAYAASR